MRTPPNLSTAFVLLYLTKACAMAAEPTPEQVEFFENRIRPVLAQKCYGCHGSKMKAPLGGLRLDSRAGLLKGGDSGPALDPGHPEVSRLISAIAYTGDLKMPPSGKLSDQQIQDFTAWVKMGAPDPRNEDPTSAASAKKSYDFAAARKAWPFRPIQDWPVPETRDRKWTQSPVDAFILARLEQKDLAPAPPADKRTLIRRVTYDLIGLPPTREEIAAFLSDNSPGAFAKVIDRLLASPHYGERWARHWLDLVRYSETNGHEFDNNKPEPWRYRDYVIRAFNEDVPYNLFAREHIAGDLVRQPRLTKDGAFMESAVGTSYYWFGEVLNSATDSIKSRADEVDNQIDVTGKTFLGLTVACARCHDHKFDPIPTADYYALAGVMHSTKLQEDAIDSEVRRKEIARIAGEIEEVNQSIRRLTNKRHQDAPPLKLRAGDELFADFPGSTYQDWTIAGQAFLPGPRLGIASSAGTGSDTFTGILTSKTFRMPKAFVHIHMAGTATDKLLKENAPLRVTLVTDGYKGQSLTPEGGQQFGWRTMPIVLERGRLCHFEIVDRSRTGHIAVDKIIFSDSKKSPEEESPLALEDLSSAADSPELAALLDRKAKLEAALPESEFTMLATDDEPKNVKIHIRGNHQNLGAEAPRRLLQVVAGEEQSPIAQGSGRMEIADRITSESDPLFSRVMVNRIWKHHFGTGIVRTPDNFGKMGEPPTHPELLDYLAAKFIASGYSIKAMHRLMLLTSSYQMSSTSSSEADKADPENKLFHRMPVQRLEGEIIRDGILAVSGSLNPKLYGPSIPPYISSYQDGRGKPVSGPLDADGRRSIYIQVRRNFLTPLFLAFDYPLPISTIGNRSVSTVPSQALMMMNNEFVLSEARKWAMRMESRNDPIARVREMYETAFGRPPVESESAMATQFISHQTSHYRSRSNPQPEREAWVDLAHVMINSPEFLYIR